MSKDEGILHGGGGNLIGQGNINSPDLEVEGRGGKDLDIGVVGGVNLIMMGEYISWTHLGARESSVGQVKVLEEKKPACLVCHKFISAMVMPAAYHIGLSHDKAHENDMLMWLDRI